MKRWRIELPPGVRAPFEVYVNGVPQRQGTDYEVRGATLVFERQIAKEGRLGAWRWFLGAWGIGTYRKNDVVDVRYQRDGRMMVAHDLPVTAPEGEPPVKEGNGPFGTPPSHPGP